MESEKTKWIHRHAERALFFWHRQEHILDVSEEYRRQLEIDLAILYDDPLKREFAEKLWLGSQAY